MQSIETEVVTGSTVMAWRANDTATGAANYDVVRCNAMKPGILSLWVVCWLMGTVLRLSICCKRIS
jgi:hypothetical protein